MPQLRALLLALALAACGQGAQAPAPAQAPEAEDPLNIQIEVGRYGVMLGHVADLTADRPGVGEADPAQSREIARALRETVWRYNLERSRLCARGLFSDVACGPAYEPVWIAEPANAEPALTELQARSDALGGEVMRFWDAVCEDARTREPDEDARRMVCAIE
jgi:hypothetical protein